MISSPPRKSIVVDIGPLFDRQPPAAVESETALLGAMMQDSSCIEDVAAVIRSADDFCKPAHAIVFENLIAFSRESGNANMVQLHQRLADQGVLDDIGGIDFLLNLMESVPDPSGALGFARTIRDKAMLRSLINSLGEALHLAYHSDDSAESVLDAAQAGINSIESMKSDDDFVSVGEVLREVESDLEARAEGKVTHELPTGFSTLDQQLDEGGFLPGEVVVVGARPSIGKSVILVNLALSMAEHGTPTAYFSLEMGQAQNGKRILARSSGVSTPKMRHPDRMDRATWQEIQQTVAQASDLPLYLMSTSSLSAERFRSLCRRAASRKGVKAVFLDYLQLMDGGRGTTRAEQVAHISRTVKQTAMDLGIVIIVASQINREGVQGTNPGMPSMHQLRESGAIEQDADTILLLHRDDYYVHQNDPHAQWSNTIDVAIAKQREGATGIHQMYFDGARRRFGDLSREALYA